MRAIDTNVLVRLVTPSLPLGTFDRGLGKVPGAEKL
jgi:hypothetical protein